MSRNTVPLVFTHKVRTLEREGAAKGNMQPGAGIPCTGREGIKSKGGYNDTNSRKGKEGDGSKRNSGKARCSRRP